jgi:ribosomal protein S18 acetylase RimI-like enzyme
MTIREAVPSDRAQLRAIFDHIVKTGQGFPEAHPLDDERFAASWIDPPVVVVAVDGEVGSERVLGAYYLKPNFPGRAAHIANAGYVVAEWARGRGIGQSLVEDSIVRAPREGFDAIQFNLVFESNPARALYERLGWREIGRIPRGVADQPALIYWRDV